MKRRTNLWMAAAVMAVTLSAAGSVYAGEETSGESLEAWETEAGWTAFYTFTQEEKLNAAWEAAAEAFGPAIGMEDLDGDGLKAMNVQVCGMEDDIVRFEFEDDTVTALDSKGDTVFSNEYAYTAAVENAIEGAEVYVYRTEASDAGKYTYLCLTLPDVESEEGGVMTYFRLRWTEDGYEELFAEDYSGVTGVMVDAATPEEDLDYTIRLLYGADPEP